MSLDNVDERRYGVRTIRKLLIQASEASAAGAPSSSGLPFAFPLPGGNNGSSSRSSTEAPMAPMPSPVSAEYVGRVMGQLACEEVVALQDWEAVARAGPQIKWVYPGLLERVCVAHMLHGYLQCQPGYVKVAAGVLAKLPASGEVLVLQAVCCVLMGAVQAAEERLMEAETAAHARPSQSFLSPPSDMEVGGKVMGKLWSSQAFTFVADHTPANEEGLLTGLCLYTELWLAKVAVLLFRDTVESVHNTSLVPYFADARVEAIISVYDEKAEVDSTPKGLPAQALQHLGAANRQSPSLASTSGSRLAAAQDDATNSDMGIKKAGQVVRAWQEAKQAALGRSHDVSQLPNVLAEPMLGETWRKAATFREQGWFMRYKLHRLKVTEVDTKATGKRPNVTVLASLDESASLCGMDGQQADGYRSSYDAQYRMVQGKDGLWRVASVEVLGEEMNGGKQ
ncbi:hypothetical protein DUNSADRAFT_8388 [Dunaliella salina]|uniref:ARC6 IMS domain-containing protein n=2 Tax=Dunaliella salina TaxID=3046 RepID=A0ABQ7GJM1_DUNSA|nr:hypothetical protein DUNSADRAFT_8388 [Dunaliella salina]|eukprot:KAF5834804.1 hypothetical protein DUNSADRAFT_8388 [Dunaliella salina]